MASLPKRQIRLFLRHLWSIAGSVSVDRPEGAAGRGRVCLPGIRRQGLEDVARLLLRFGISSRLGDSGVPTDPRGGSVGPPEWALSIEGRDDQRRFLGEIGVHGARQRRADDAARRGAGGQRAGAGGRGASQRVWSSVHEVLALEVDRA